MASEPKKLETTASQSPASRQDREPNFRNDEGKLYLVRCFECYPAFGRENYVLNVASGVCTWCGWSEDALTTDDSAASSPESSPDVE